MEVKTEVSILIMIFFICGAEGFVDETKNNYCFYFFWVKLLFFIWQRKNTIIVKSFNVFLVWIMFCKHTGSWNFGRFYLSRFTGRQLPTDFMVRCLSPDLSQNLPNAKFILLLLKVNRCFYFYFWEKTWNR